RSLGLEDASQPLAVRLARLYWLRLARVLGDAREPLIAHRVRVCARLGTLARSAKKGGRRTGKLSEARSCSSSGAPFAKREFAAGSSSPKWRRRHESERATCRRSRTNASSSYRA